MIAIRSRRHSWRSTSSLPTIEDVLAHDGYATVAKQLEDVIAAWRLVYRVYQINNFIAPNPFEIHTAPQAVSPNTAVFTSFSGHIVESTYTAIIDGETGLPLDRVYREELDRLREQNRKLMECCLFADVRQLGIVSESRMQSIRGHVTRKPSSRDLGGMRLSMIELMRFAFHYAQQHDVTDFVIGVHPRHARYYNRAFGFEPFGDLRTYPTVNHRPVVLLRANVARCCEQAPHHYPVLRYVVTNTVSPFIFHQCYKFASTRLRGQLGEIDHYLDHQYPDWTRAA